MAEIADEVRDYILVNYLFGNQDALPRDNESLVGSGVVDSTGILELIEFIESNFDVSVEESETVPENLDSIERIALFVASKALPSQGQ